MVDLTINSHHTMPPALTIFSSKGKPLTCLAQSTSVISCLLRPSLEWRLAQ